MKAFIWVLVLMVGCGGRSWPVVTATTAPGFAAGQLPVQTVDVLPLDVAVTRHPEDARDERRVADGMRRAAESTIYDGLGRRGYRVGQRMVMAGMSEEEVVATLDSLSMYGYAQGQHGTRELLVPYLPVALGADSGADATLYVGGWAYLGKDPPAASRGKRIAKWVLIGTVVVVAVVVVAVLARKGALPGGSVVRAAGSSVGRVADVAARTSFRVARLAGHVVRATFDGLGRSHTHLHVCTSNDPGGCAIQPAGPHPYHSASMGHERVYGQAVPPSVMEMEMTLVDNRSGRTLWHTRQRFEATAARPGEVREVMQRMLAALPRSAAAAARR